MFCRRERNPTRAHGCNTREQWQKSRDWRTSTQERGYPVHSFRDDHGRSLRLPSLLGIARWSSGKEAIAVFAPRLEEAGNSVKAQKVIEYVADKLDYNVYSPSSVGLK